MGSGIAGRSQARRYFFPNDREATKAAGTDDLWQAINVLAGLAKIVIVKRGASAAICRSGQEQCSLMPPSVKPVDDVGAGDSFAAGFIHKFLTEANLEDGLAFANLAGAYSTTKEGGNEAFRDRAALNDLSDSTGAPRQAVSSLPRD